MELSRSAALVPWLFLASFLSCLASLHSEFPLQALPSDSGYLLVNDSTGSRMFFAFYEAISPQNDLASTPIILWLQGGPGCSGMVGNFYELGPWRVGEDKELHQNSAPWNRLFGVLFVDNPVGVGFSIAPTVEDIPTDELQVASDLYKALEAFFGRNKGFRERPLYVTGESYAGKYVPALSEYILGKKGEIRLDGLAIGNGLTHPVAQVMVHAPTAYAMGLIDARQAAEAQKLAGGVVGLIEEEDWAAAHAARTELLSYLSNETGLATLLDVRREVPYYTTEFGEDYVTEFLNRREVRQALRAEDRQWEDCSEVVGERLANDTMKSTKHLVEKLLTDGIPVLLYQGQFDLQDGVASTEKWMETIRWDGLPDFFASERRIWTENGTTLAGYVRSYSVLTHVVVSNAGHLVPADQNLHSQRMIEAWISGDIAALA